MAYKLSALIGALMVSAALPAAAACDPDYTGVTLNVGVQTGPFVASALKIAGENWEKKTCGKVNVIEFPFGELFPKYITALTGGTGDFDVMAFTPAWLPDMADQLTDMPESIRTGDYWDDIHPSYKERLMVWNGAVKAAQMDGDMHTLQYRGDLFENPEEQKKFKEKYGYDLAAPKTWDQYYDIAQFFTRPDQGLYGTAEAYKRGGQQFWYFFSHAASYTNNPNVPGSMFFDPDTMKAQVNNEGWVKALEDYKRGVAFNPPGALNNGSSDIRPIYAGGQVAMNIDWGDSGVLGADKKESRIVGHVRASMLPGSTKIWNIRTNSWDEFPEPVASPFLAFGGWQLGVPNSSANIEAAWNYVQEATSVETSGKAIVTPGTGVNPYRVSHLTNVDNWSTIFSKPEAESYLGAIKDTLDAKNVTFDLRLPGFFSYTEVLEIELSKALAGEVEPKAALDAVAAEWDRLTEEFGKDKQLAAYRASMGLPPLQ